MCTLWLLYLNDARPFIYLKKCLTMHWKDTPKLVCYLLNLVKQWYYLITVKWFIFFLLLECKRWILFLFHPLCCTLPFLALYCLWGNFPVQALPIYCLMLRLQISSGDLSLGRKRCMNRHECLSVVFQMQHDPMGNDFYSLAILSYLASLCLTYSFYKTKGGYLLYLEWTNSSLTQSGNFCYFPGLFFSCCL